MRLSLSLSINERILLKPEAGKSGGGEGVSRQAMLVIRIKVAHGLGVLVASVRRIYFFYVFIIIFVFYTH